MQTEFEATFYPVDIDTLQNILTQQWYICTKPLYTQIRTTFHFPAGHEKAWSFARVRNESDQVTMTIKQFVRDGDIESQKECELVVDDYDTAIQFLQTLWCTSKATQETRREIWQKDNVYIMIDERPFLDALVEIESIDKSSVQKAAIELGYSREEAIFDSVTEIYSRVYNISHDRINNDTPEIKFDIKNPFVV